MFANAPDIRLPPKWIELNLMKRECAVFIATAEDELVCQCGKRRLDHEEDVFARPIKSVRGEEWSPSRHTTLSPTDAYGQIIFEGEHHPNKSRYVRVSHDTSPELIMQLMTLVWGMEMPKLLITVRGGDENFDLPPRLGKILQLGLLKAAKSTNAWVFTNGLNIGVTKHVGTALGSEQRLAFKRGRCVSVGIAPWGVTDHRQDLIGRNRDRVYCPIEHPGSKFGILSSRLSNFFLVDNGTVGKAGADIYFRKRLEKTISSYPMSPHRACDTPVVCVVIEGGVFTIKIIAEYLNEDPPIPVVVFGHTGRASDLIAYIVKKVSNAKELDAMKEEVFAHLTRIFHTNASQCQLLYHEIKKIVARKSLLTIFTPHQAEDEGFDTVLLASIFRSQHWTPLQQLSLTLAWDRVDIATNEVFVYGREWSRDSLEHAMMEALISDRLNFVNLLLEHGLNIQTFLTPARLEGLYSLERTHSLQMRRLLFELARNHAAQHKFQYSKNGVPDRNLTLHEVGLAMSHMMGHIYKSKYLHLRGLKENSDRDVEFLPKRYDSEDYEDQRRRAPCFSQPFDDLFIWAVLTKRHAMALLLWCHGPGALAKALVAVKLNSYFAEEVCTAEQTNMSSEFKGYAEEWEALSLELLDSCFRQDPKMARELLMMELDHWSKQTCLTLAVIANHRMLLGHPCCQILLADLWMGALNIRKHSTIKIILGILCPPFTMFLEFKSTEELKLLPHQEKHDFGLISGTNHAEASTDNESARTFPSRSRGSHNSFTSMFHNAENIHMGNGTESPTPTEIPAVNMQEVSYRLQEYKKQPHGHHSNRHARFQEKHVLQDSGATGSYIFQGGAGEAAYEYRNRPHNHHHHHRHPHESGNRRYYNFKDEYPGHSSYVTTRHELSCWNKFYEFQKAPVTNFYRHMISYVVFACVLAYIMVVPQDEAEPSWLEYYVILYLVTLGMDCIREFLSIDAYNWSQKWREFRGHFFTLLDFFAVSFFMAAVSLRFLGHFKYGILMYKVSSIYWNLRLYKYMGVHRFVGPKIVMMSRMLGHMAYFAMIIVVVLLSFGLLRESIRYPDTYPTIKEMTDAFLEPYTMMFGEVDLDSITYSHCGEPGYRDCPFGHWIIPLAWVIYMMVSNVLIVNVLIAVFNGIYSEVDAVSLEVWMFQRFTFVMEFEQKPLLPPPLIAINHMYSILKFSMEKCLHCVCDKELDTKGGGYEDGPSVILGNDHSLKTFLTPAEASIVFDFEEDNVDALSSTNVSLRRLMEVHKTHIKSWGSQAVGQEKTDFKHRILSTLRSSLHDINSKVEENRNKLDKLLEILEAASEGVADEDEFRQFTALRTASGTRRSFSLTPTTNEATQTLGGTDVQTAEPVFSTKLAVQQTGPSSRKTSGKK